MHKAYSEFIQNIGIREGFYKKCITDYIDDNEKIDREFVELNIAHHCIRKTQKNRSLHLAILIFLIKVKHNED
jgi:hypothetical protein